VKATSADVNGSPSCQRTPSAQVEGVDAGVGADLPALGQVGVGVRLVVEPDEAVEHRVGDRVDLGAGGDRRVEVAGVLADADDQRAAALWAAAMRLRKWPLRVVRWPSMVVAGTSTVSTRGSSPWAAR
jgi:hypothetical protein